jgi:hypothetical protein
MSNSGELIRHWLAELGSQSNASFFLDSNNRCGLVGNGLRFVLDAPDDSGVVMLIVTLTESDATELDADTLISILKLNHERKRTGGGVISMDPLHEKLFFTYTFDVAKREYTDFRNVISNFAILASDIKRSVGGLINNSFHRQVERPSGFFHLA